jgi:hypothetical protein
VLTEGGIKLRLQHLQQRLLDQPIRHRRDAKLALASVRLRDRYPSYRLWPVRPCSSCSRIEGHSHLRRSAVSSIDRPSIPAAPLLDRTRFHACCIFSLARTAFSSPAPVSSVSCRGRRASSLTGIGRASPCLYQPAPLAWTSDAVPFVSSCRIPLLLVQPFVDSHRLIRLLLTSRSSSTSSPFQA